MFKKAYLTSTGEISLTATKSALSETIHIEIYDFDKHIPAWFTLEPYGFIYDKSQDRFYFLDTDISDFYDDILNEFIRELKYIPTYIKCETVEKQYWHRLLTDVRDSDCFPVFKVQLKEKTAKYFETPSKLRQYNLLKSPEGLYYFCPSFIGSDFFFKFNIFMEENKITDNSYVLAAAVRHKNTVVLESYVSGWNPIIDLNKITIDENMLYTSETLEDILFTDVGRKYIHDYIAKYLGEKNEI